MRSFSILGCLMFGASLALAGSPEWEKSVRALAQYPKAKADVGVSIDSDGEFTITNEAAKPKLAESALKALLKEFRDTPEDFLKISPIIDALQDAAQHAKVDEFANKAIRLWPEYLKNHPQDVASMSWIGLTFARQGKIPEAEFWLRRATQTLPKDAGAWRELATYYYNRALQIALGGKPVEFDDPTLLFKLGPVQRQTFRAHLVRTAAHDKHEAVDFLEKAADCFDWAVLLAPDDVKARVFRCDWQTFLLILIIHEPNPEIRQQLTSIMKSRNILREDLITSDSRRAAELSSNPLSILYAFFMVMINSPRSMNDPSQGHKDFFRKMMSRLEQFRQSSDPKTARDAKRVQVILGCLVFDDRKTAAKTLQTMKPDVDDVPQDHLTAAVFEEPTKLIELMEYKLALRDDPGRSLFLGTALIVDEQFDAARKRLREAVRKHPDDQKLAALFAALLIKEGTAADLPEASRLLSKVEADFDKRLQEMTTRKEWDEKTPGLPPLKDRGELCYEIMPDEDRELLRITRVNRVILMGLAGKRSDVFELLEKWQVFSRKDHKDVLEAYRMTEPGGLADDQALSPTTGGLLQPRNKAWPTVTGETDSEQFFQSSLGKDRGLPPKSKPAFRYPELGPDPNE